MHLPVKSAGQKAVLVVGLLSKKLMPIPTVYQAAFSISGATSSAVRPKITPKPAAALIIPATPKRARRRDSALKLDIVLRPERQPPQEVF